MQADELESRIAAFPRWAYRFEFDGGVSTPLPDLGMVNRHAQRRRYFFEPLLTLLGGSLDGRRVLDLGCNSGYWSLAAIEAGADFVLGLDAVEMYVEQARLVFEAKGVDPARYAFERRNVFGAELGRGFDVVLCLGLMERVAKPVELFELMSRAGADVIVIDTEISRSRASLFEVDRLYDRESVVDYATVLVPSRDALIELAAEFGYETAPLRPRIDDYSGMRDYLHQRRLAFICSRGPKLDGIDREQRSGAPWWVSALSKARAGRR